MAKNNIDYLSTGNSGVEPTFGNEEQSPEQTEAINEQQRQLAELLPSVQHIIDACDDEIDAISDIRSYKKDIGELTTEVKRQAFMDEMRARELYIAYIERLKTSIQERISNAENEAKK